MDFRTIIRKGDVVAWPQGPGEPLGLTGRLVAQRHELPRAGIFIGLSASETLSPAHADSFTLRGLNGAGTNRRLTAANVLDIIPAHVSSIAALIAADKVPIDIALLRVRPHPTPGYFTVGVMCDYTQAMVKAARVVVAELDMRLPVTSQDALLPQSAIDILVDADGAEISMPDPLPSASDRSIANHVAGLIPDRATVQLGIGGLPAAVAAALVGHKDLGIHSGVISDAVADLIEKGVVTNACKGLDAGCTVTGGLFGTRRLFDFADGNPAIHMRALSHTHNVAVMAQVNRLHSVNSAIEIDLSGQVNAESAAGRYLGAVGGQADFVRGAQASEGGRSIIAMSAVTPDGKQSRIVTSLGRGPVTTARADVDTVVTEFGVAELRGASLTERKRKLIAIAHPDHRESLDRPAGETKSPAVAGVSR
ncbi:acetyl-CoA hydrolase/transferase C-terminal domain-containing protein [Bradyrhizobium sp. LHD-71]|uniref:acetyl-CoA hydrolase/transferase family protein n=1 Tax=Bradyrhizobium sp. LHD-71 TaxID=3072141 RepID=UPI00280FB4F1|nr:acetyl-CoA hydrolase/transferase C-terminal domain-containing protein [Bradyrhizobium sp. LHD-71]MDQ8728221.1 acetyl-CoA hydrolase/transferase C-terminal domain-containing protein [Bradyrhizobium sp. LHD-71]